MINTSPIQIPYTPLLQSGCIGLYPYCIGASGLHWDCVCIAMGLYFDCTGIVLLSIQTQYKSNTPPITIRWQTQYKHNAPPITIRLQTKYKPKYIPYYNPITNPIQTQIHPLLQSYYKPNTNPINPISIIILQTKNEPNKPNATIKPNTSPFGKYDCNRGCIGFVIGL